MRLREVRYRMSSSGRQENGYFHQWMMYPNDGIIGLVETKRGDIVEVEREDIQFITKPEIQNINLIQNRLDNIQ